MDGQSATVSQRNRLTQLFEFLKAYVEQRYPPVRDVDKQVKTLWLSNLPQHPCVRLNRDSAGTDEAAENVDVVLQITRPTVTSCPSPPPNILEWLKPGWENVDGLSEVHASRNTRDRDGHARFERFEDVAERPSSFKAWQRKRDEWVLNERPARRALAAFQAVYEWYGIQERESERIEILLGDGLLTCADDSGDFNHPVLLQRLELEFHPEKRSPEFVFRKREKPPELYLEFLRAIPNANLQQIAKCADELKKTEFPPMGGEDTEGFLQRLIQGVFPASGRAVVPNRNLEAVLPQDGGNGNANSAATRTLPVIVTQNGDRYELSDPSASRITGPISSSNLDASLRRLRDHGWEPRYASAQHPMIGRDPVIFMRERQSGLSNFFELILEDIPSRSDFPNALLQILGLTPAASNGQSDEIASLPLGNEDEDVLLSKPANKEQLEIARQLARRDCVLVQGPPGTGKTHTIANLLGHLLAQGKRVLVTAHTPKALRVLRQKVVEPLQPLCISVLQNDKESQEDLRDSVKLIHLGLSKDARILEREASKLQQARSSIIEQLRESRSRLLDAIQDETRSVVFGGKEIRPIDAAKRVKDGVGLCDWIPSPVKLGAAVPLSFAEIAALYQTNARITLDDERELNAVRPDMATLPTPTQFRDLLNEIALLQSQNVAYREELWDEIGDPNLSAQFDSMLALAVKTIEFLRNRAPWQLDAVQAGRDGTDAKRVWVSLVELIESTWQEVHDCNVLIIAHGPRLEDKRSPYELLPTVEEIIQHVEAGKSFGLLTKLTKPGWHRIIDVAFVGNRRPKLDNPTHFRAIRALLRAKVVRQELTERWERLISVQGGPTAAQLSDKPELVCRQFVPEIQTCLGWHTSTWLPLETEFQRVGFKWAAYLQSVPPQTGNNAELRRLREAVLGDLESILTARAAWLRLRLLRRALDQWRALLPQTDLPEAAATCELRQALCEALPDKFEKCYQELIRLKNLEPDLKTRRSLLAKLRETAPAWASAIENRHPLHLMPEPHGDSSVAWEWRQLNDELECRANKSIQEIQHGIERLSRELLEVTSELVENLTWANLIRKTTAEQRQALGSYAKMRDRLTKSGKGVQDAEMRAGARREMSVAIGAVPVWIMPLNEVAENFDPRRTRFDVVIIDEASQCEPTAMFALYLGRQTVIVGDDEQVTPTAVGVEMEQVQRLKQVHLQDVPFKELYDGQTSIYEFAQIAFGGVIRLVEHFRCAPNIIAFSNNLSYHGEIKPLREASSISLPRHVLPYRVEVVRGQNGEVNGAEAETTASLLCAAIEEPEYATNGEGKPMSFGVVSLVGPHQAMAVDAILRQRLEPTEYKQRRILCGQAAQFQGDERDVMFLSVVDAPPSDPPLPMRQEGPKKIFKKRFNVAASRARDQMWVVYSVNHETDLKPGDYRRILIEHAIDPEAWERELERRLAQVDAHSREFEGRVLRHLMERNFQVLPQYKVGSYRIDLVVAGSGKRLAIECDGERSHGPERLQDDMDRQSILERLGWKFVRIRGSVFFRDEGRAMRPVFQRLEELGIQPDFKHEGAAAVDSSPDEVTQRIVRRAEQLRNEWRQEDAQSMAAAPSPKAWRPWQRR